jgi:hemolysin activation/secretion protein
LPYKTTGIVKVAAQFATSDLLGVEQFELGGMNTVRGFPEGALFAHSGYFTNVELRRPIPYLPNYKYLPLKDRIELAVFYDNGLGQIRGQKVKSGNFLQSVGTGLRIHLTNYLNANLDLGIPLGSGVTGVKKDSVRFHFNISSDVI